ncbi:unnamed protein product [Closterium sp. Yama58-4]|nr:unnamed protein product [Closterium sp. Yama58-4]
MPHSSEAVDSSASQSASPGMQPWSQEFTDHFRQHFLLKHLGAAAFSQNTSYNQHTQDLKQQQQRSEGVGSAALAFGGLSYEECMKAFLAPNARCCLPPAPPCLSSLATPPSASQAPLASQSPLAASQAATSTAAPDRTTKFAHEAFPVAAASTAAALHRSLKRPRDDCSGWGTDQPPPGGRESHLLRGRVVKGGVACSTERRLESVAEQFQQQGESSCMQAEEEALLEALLQEEHRQQTGGAGSRAQRVLWPRVGSESALLDDVLLGCSGDEPAFTQCAALSAPPPTQPHEALPAPVLSQLAALSGSAPCIGDFALLPIEWPCVGSESALPDDVLLGVCCENPASAQRAALSAPPPTQPLAAPLPSPFADLPGPAPGSASKRITAMLAGSACGTQE